MNDSEGLEYVSSSPLLNVDTVKKPKDERDIRTLEVVLDLLKNRIAYYDSNSALTVDEGILTIKEQLAVVKRMVVHLSELQGLIVSAIEEVENGRQ